MRAPAGKVIVVGGGVIGTWHALEFLGAGFEVTHLEADGAPRGASVRNFGLVWVSGRRSGVELDVALRARRRWEEVGAEVPGIGFRANGSLTVATTMAERSVFAAFAGSADAADRSIAFLDSDEVVDRNPALRGDVAGALWCERDGVVEPGRILGAMRQFLQQRFGDRYRFYPGHRVVATGPSGAVVDAVGTRWEADVVVLAPGAAYDQLSGTGPGARATVTKLRRVRLQMLETAPLPGPELTTSLADADTLRYYPAYEHAPLGDLGPQSSVAAQHHLQLLVVQRPDGGLTIGDTHAYDEPFEFALSEDPMIELVSRAERILGVPVPPVRRRWKGIYAQCLDGDVCLRTAIEDNVWLVTGPGGRGMTCAPAIAADTLAALGVTVGPSAVAQ